ncbi:hypothetical protein [Longitalea luteola]|uniref:hypothetical protein n=1 Tax=Longitalea luteola TaxID=2812563 RepID=UPI001A9636D8|nr:hypothetical protein [Longitalea luteola]
MRKIWPVCIVASFLNTFLVTGAFIEFKLRGIAVFELPVRTTGFPAWYDISPFQFAGGIFVLSFLMIMTVLGIKTLASGILLKVHSFNESLKNGQLAVSNEQ